MYYPNLVIMPVDNNEHQGLVTYLLTVLYGISYGIQSVETMGFAL